ncbi:GNAT family N-acetyltransferase [Paenibacillus humicola]|uniref:GNAT family N-acetyltransferase n=1 Tax=Paenibacillus humicola TaxID=3110540 RepID=UPI00237BFFB3|nr:GNAT family N-acetyltransferase [Paenibacillus humicola]
MDFDIRLLHPSDAEICRELRLRSLKENPEAFLTTFEVEREKPLERFRENLTVTDDRFTLGAFIGDELAGMVTFVREAPLKARHKGSVLAMYVAPERRGKGIGAALIRELAARVRRLGGVEQLNLSVISDNEAAKRLYAAAGFAVYGHEPRSLKAGNQYWDEDYMVLRLT